MSGQTIEQAASGLESLKTECRELAKDVVRYIAQGDQIKPFNSHCKTLRRTVKEVLQRHEILFGSMLDKLQLMGDKNGGKQTFERVASEIFEDGKYNWGRLVSVYALAARVAQYYAQADLNNSDSYYNMIAAYTGDFVVQRLAAWINSNGGWDEFERYFEENQAEKTIWKGMLATAAFGLGALVAAGIVVR